MKRSTTHRRWLWAGLVLVLCLVLAVAMVFVLRPRPHPIDASLDTLAAIPLPERWAHPAMTTIRSQGAEGVHSLGDVLREKDSLRTRFLLWLASQSPAATNLPNFPDLRKMEERRWAACQAITQLGPAARSLVPDLVELLRNADIGTGNQVTMALYAIGRDSEMVDRLARMLESGGGGSARGQVLYMLETGQPPAPRTVRVLQSALNDESPWVQEAAVTLIGRSRLNTPDILVRLKAMQRAGTNDSLMFSASEALWALEKKEDDVWLPTITHLETNVVNYSFRPPGGGSGGQGVDGPEGIYLKAASLWARMGLKPEEQKRARAVLNTFCEKSDRIFIRMLLLPDMVGLGLELTPAAEVCRAGLSASEDYYNIQAARLALTLCDKWHSAVASKISGPGMLGHTELGVQVYGAQFYWNTEGQHRRADIILPVLVEALQADKHQSYYYPEIQTATLNLLAQMGRDAQPALPALRHLEKDVNPAVANQAIQAIKRIAPE